MKHYRVFFFLLLTLSFSLCARDSRWVNSSFKWQGTGAVCTEIFPLFGEYFRVTYSCPKGSLKITLVDVSDDQKRLEDKIVVNSWNQTLSDRKEFKGRSKAFLLIEGGSSEWQVTVDQYLDTIQEWAYKNYAGKQSAISAQKKVAVWASEGPSQIEYTPRGASWCISSKSEDGSPVRVTVNTIEEKPRVLYKGILRKADITYSGWIHSKEPVLIKVECAEDAAWGIEASAP